MDKDIAWKKWQFQIDQAIVPPMARLVEGQEMFDAT